MEKGKKLDITEILDYFEKLILSDKKTLHVVESTDSTFQEIWITENYRAYSPSNHIDSYEIKGKNINKVIEDQLFFKDIDTILTKLETLPTQTVNYSYNYYIRKITI